MENEFLTEKQLLEQLKISPSTIYRYRLSGKLPFKRFDRTIRYTQSDVNTFLLRSQNNMENLSIIN